jgi:hypothetical protein
VSERYVRVVVHGTVPASSAEEAIELVCQRIRDGIGPEGDGREWGLAIAAAAVADEIVFVNEEYLRRSRL